MLDLFHVPRGVSLGQCTSSSGRGEGCLNIVITVYKRIWRMHTGGNRLALEAEGGEICNDLQVLWGVRSAESDWHP